MRKTIIGILLILGLYSCSSSQNATSSIQNDRDGSSYEKAIIIKANNETDGVRLEYAMISKIYPNYKMKSQSTGYKDNKNYDMISIITADGKEIKVYFDITNFFGKF